MADPFALTTLILQETKATIYRKLLSIAVTSGLVTETWEEGDPTRSLFDAVASRWETWESIIPETIKGGYLGLASGDWLTLLLDQVYNVTRRKATYATCTVLVTNATNENLGLIDVDDLTFRNPTTDVTFRNVTSGTLGPLSTLTLDVEAETAGAIGTSAIGAISELTVSKPGVTVTNTTAAVGRDAENDDDARARGKAKVTGGLSQAGAKNAYDYAIKTDELQTDGLSNVTRTRILDDDARGRVGIIIAGDGGAVTSPDRDKAEAAVETWANPFMVPVTVYSATNLVLAITYTLWVYDTVNLTTAEIKTAVEAALLEDLKARPIGGDVIPPDTSGKIYKGWLENRILAAVAPHGFRCSVATPAADVSLALVFNPDAPGSNLGEVAVLGVVTATVKIIEKKGAS